MNATTRTDPPASIPGYRVEVDGALFEQLVQDALAELSRTGRRLDYESLGQFMGVYVSLLREVVTIEPVEGS